MSTRVQTSRPRPGSFRKVEQLPELRKAGKAPAAPMPAAVQFVPAPVAPPADPRANPGLNAAPPPARK